MSQEVQVAAKYIKDENKPRKNMGHLKHFGTCALHDLDKPNLQFLVNSQHFWFPGPASSFLTRLILQYSGDDQICPFRYLSYRFHKMLRLTASNWRRPYFLCQWYENVKSSIETKDAFSPSMLYPGENREGYFWQVNHSFIPSGLRNVPKVLFFAFLEQWQYQEW